MTPFSSMLSKNHESFILGIAGGSGSGKTTLAYQLKATAEGFAEILSQDHYYIDQSARFTGDGEGVNFDHPNAIDFALLSSHLKNLKSRQTVNVPRYDFKTHSRLSEGVPFKPKALIIVDGILILSQPGVVSCLDFSVFIETPESVRFERRLKRDVSERGRTPEGVKKQFDRQVKPMHDQFVEPSQKNANLILSGTEDIAQNCRKLLEVLTKAI